MKMPRGFLNRSLSDGHLPIHFRLEDVPATAARARVDHVSAASREVTTIVVHSPEKKIHKKTLVMKCLVPTLLLLVGVKYQVNPDILFSEHRVQLCCLVGALCVYWSTIDYAEEMSFKLSNSIALACQPLSVFTSVSMMFPHHLSFRVFIALTTLTLIVALILMMCILFRRHIERFFYDIFRTTPRRGDEEDLSPV